VTLEQGLQAVAVTPASVNFAIDLYFKAGIIRLRAATAGQADPGYSAARDRSPL